MSIADPCLYKYASLSTAKIVLQTGRLRWTTPPLLNDPYDLGFGLFFDAVPAEVRRLATELLWGDYLDDSRPAPLAAFEAWKRERKAAQPLFELEAFAEETGPIIDRSIVRTSAVDDMNRQLQANLRKVKLLCLSETPDNMLMWSHYGEQHAGAVLRFARAGEDNAFATARAVDYVEGMPRFGDSATMAGLIAGRLVDSKAMTALQLYTKAAAWRYEREWRMTLGFGRDPSVPFEDLPFGDELLTGVVLGCRMPEADRAEVVALARALNPDAELLAAKPAVREFRMELAPYGNHA